MVSITTLRSKYVGGFHNHIENYVGGFHNHIENYVGGFHNHIEKCVGGFHNIEKYVCMWFP